MEYANLPSRVKAAIIDAIVVILLIFTAAEIIGYFDPVPDYVRMICFVFIFVLYDPLFTSFLGGTIGHHQKGIVVKQEKNPQKNILLHMAIARFMVKWTLGWLSLLTTTANQKRKAIHDYVAGSIVFDKNPVVKSEKIHPTK